MEVMPCLEAPLDRVSGGVVLGGRCDVGNQFVPHLTLELVDTWGRVVTSSLFLRPQVMIWHSALVGGCRVEVRVKCHYLPSSCQALRYVAAMCHCYEGIPEGVLVQVGGGTPGLTVCPPWPIGGVHPVGGVTLDLTLCPLWTTEMTAGDIAAGSTPYLCIPSSLPLHSLPCC